MKSEKIDVVIFDLDDTLYHEIDYLKSAYRSISLHVEQQYGYIILYELMLQYYEKGLDVFAFIEEQTKHKVTKNELLDMYRLHNPAICLNADALLLLNKLKKQGCRMGIITDGRTITQQNKIKALGLYRFIDIADCIISESIGSEKPSEANYKYFMDKYPTSTYCYIGDNVRKDFITPNRLGWTTICLLDNGENIHKQNFERDKEYLPNITVKSLNTIF